MIDTRGSEVEKMGAEQIQTKQIRQCSSLMPSRALQAHALILKQGF